MHTSSFKKLTFEAPLVLFTCGTLLIAVLLTRFLLLPTVQEITRNQVELRHYTTLISSESGYATLKNELRKKLELLESRLSSNNGEKNTPADLSSFLETLIAVAKKADIRFVRMQPQTESHDRDFTLSPVLLELTTTYHALGQFIAELEKLPHLFTVTRLAISASRGGNCEVKLLATCLVPGDGNNE